MKCILSLCGRGRRWLMPLSVLALFAPAVQAATDTPMNHGNVAWMLVATLLVLMMAVPGVALFYGGLVRSKNVLSVLAQVLCVLAMALLAWMAYGYSLAFSGGGAVLGNLHEAFLLGITPTTRTAASSGLPTYL
ncbi:MAG TPA: ammonia channel protein, partial [Rhodanobacteraceae bacterium]